MGESESGQFPHDAALGAFIAIKAGAHLGGPSGVNIGVEDLGAALMTPSGAAMQYILASTKELALELAAALGSRECSTPVRMDVAMAAALHL